MESGPDQANEGPGAKTKYVNLSKLFRKHKKLHCIYKIGK